ncbi:uncharacterized protein B0T23DRAFT_359251 [Neurospora hispaniola]|uniref:Nudix hydrolase domain-containing protein n=1 Tax=Neurospora hispaniola TaxID=588809 RepID=A0AAJ0MRW5_9PEZI|nr:hypothetical protein B0T23DRAFT_359251 [Neurospora hispaniola]
MSTSTPSSTAPSTSTNQKPLKHRSVVSSFIFKLPPAYFSPPSSSSSSSSSLPTTSNFDPSIQKPLVALFKRSDKVSTYTHHYAPISGSIDSSDPSPLSAAWREIHEETTLTASDLKLLRQGKPYTFSDESVGREWTIWPFAFLLKDPAGDGEGSEKKIKINWEHEGWAWFDPLDVRDTEDFGGVPKLKESLRRVWFEIDLGLEAGKVLAKGCKRLEEDYVSGARQMAGDALRILRDVIDKMDDDVLDGENGDGKEAKWWKEIRMAAWHLWKNGRESMGAAIMSALLSALASVEAEVFQDHATSSKSSGKQLKSTIVSVLDREISARPLTNDQISRSFASYISRNLPSFNTPQKPLSILTLSESSTITHALSHLPILLPNFVLDIRVLESRPLLEGVSLAASLAKALSTELASNNDRQHSITIYTDASACHATRGVQLVVIGADRIASDGSVSNKTGSLSVLLATQHNAKEAKVVVLCDSEKVALPGPPEQHVVEDQGLEQVTRVWMGEGSSKRIRGAARTVLNFAHATRFEGKKKEKKHEEKEKAQVKVQVRNVSFEWCAGGLIDAYVTEEGEWNDENVKKKSEALQGLEKRLFGLL